jgi:hypothetical protein
MATNKILPDELLQEQYKYRLAMAARFRQRNFVSILKVVIYHAEGL